MHLSGYPAGNVKAACELMPALGSPNPEDGVTPLYSKAVVSILDGTQSYGQLTYDNRGGGGFFVGAMRKSSQTMPMTREDLLVPMMRNRTIGSSVVQFRDDRIWKRPQVIRVETRIIRDAQGIDNILAEVYSQIGHGWFKDGFNYIFVDGPVFDSGNGINEYRVEYRFLLTAAVPANPCGPSDVQVPALGINYQYKYTPDATGKFTLIEAEPMWPSGVPVLRLPGL